MGESDYARVERAIRYIEIKAHEQPPLGEVARVVGLSPFHFQRLFQRWAGVSPKTFLGYLTAQAAKESLKKSRSVLDAAYDAGLSAPGRLHDLLLSVEAMTPGEYKTGGRGLTIEYGTHPTPFGTALVAITTRGICGFSFLGAGGFRKALAELRRNWPAARFVFNPSKTGPIVKKIFQPKYRRAEESLKLLLKGTPFQVKVWEALLKISAGSVRAYGDLAALVGKKKAARAVGTAAGQNSIAYLIPCHRVIRETGALGRYRWGTSRKKTILAWEALRAQAKISMNSPRESAIQSGSAAARMSRVP